MRTLAPPPPHKIGVPGVVAANATHVKRSVPAAERAPERRAGRAPTALPVSPRCAPRCAPGRQPPPEEPAEDQADGGRGQREVANFVQARGRVSAYTGAMEVGPTTTSASGAPATSDSGAGGATLGIARLPHMTQVAKRIHRPSTAALAGGATLGSEPARVAVGASSSEQVGMHAY